ncbi:alpha/beta hydrolase [Actinospica sp. MGRD01-02]|uniref:Alpha/beta hydrolase n=1 Tax=Actinospica acidithermotolerans TaxID=2828514 RepID=A0A941IMS3_9ACTN|nr:alpha/beta hydrolase [Actinospica acidithermotolerans]MBR7830278.1 alpha/beta hydrolase [Actinospica acidithermotolerans]
MTVERLYEAVHRGYRSQGRVLVHPAPTMPPVLLVGGAMQRKEGWGRLEARLARESTVVTVDLPGWGGAGLLPAQFGMGFLADCLAALLRTASVGAVDVFGGSYGSAIAYQLGLRHPGLVRRIALFGALGRIPHAMRPRLTWTIGLLREGMRERFAAEVVDAMLNQDPDITLARRGTVERIIYALFHALGPLEAAQYEQNTLRLLAPGRLDLSAPPQAPLLFGVGEHDSFTTARDCRAFAQCCPGSAFVRLRDSDHPVHLRCPDELAGLLQRFFRAQDLHGVPGCHEVEYPAAAR